MSALLSCKPLRAGPVRGRNATSRRPCVLTSAGIKLYSNIASRGRIVEWYLQEIGAAADVQVINMDMREKREHKSEWFLKVNPFGKVPAMEDGDLKLFESGAILLYVADKYGQLKTIQERARASQWSHFANSTLTQSVFVEQSRERSMPELFAFLNDLLGKQPFIDGDSFTVSDVAVGAYLLYIPAFLPQVDLTPYPNVMAYMKRMADRPACAATVAARAKDKQAETVAAAGAATA